MEQPTFETKRLTIRRRTPADTEACLAMDRGPDVTRFVDGPWDDPVAHRAFVEARTRGPYPPGLGYWTVLCRGHGNAFVGWVLLMPLGLRGPEIEIGWRIRQESWGRGYATEAAAPLLRHGLVTLALPEIVADIDLLNIGSRRVAEKIGLRPRGERRHHGRRSMRYATTKELRTRGG